MAEKWQETIHKGLEKSDRNLRDEDFIEGAHRTSTKPVLPESSLAKAPKRWTPPSINVRVTESMKWYSGGSGYANAIYSEFDSLTNTLWIFDFGQQHAQLWSKRSVPAGDHPNRSDMRTRIKSKIRLLVDSIQMVMYGKKRSKFKMAELQIFFKAGGSKTLLVHEVTGKFYSAEMIEHSGTGIAVFRKMDFRLLRDEVEGENARRYVKMMEQNHEHHAALISKQKTKTHEKPI